MRGGVNQF
jgi:hypothetical protein